MADYNKTDPILNQKLPPNPDVTIRSDIVYPYVGGSEGYYGEHNIHSQFGDVNTAFTQIYDITSGYNIRENTQSGNSVIHSFDNGHVFKYISGGHSSHVDGNISKSTKGQNHDVTVGSRGIETGKNIFEGAGGSKISGTGGDGSFENHAGGNRFVTTSGDHITQHDGSIHTSVNGDMVHAVAGNKYDTVKGEKGIFVQDGNYDIQVSNGQTRIAVSSNLSFISNTSISFIVGQSSFVMTPQGITMIGAQPNGVWIQSNQSNVTLYANGGPPYVVVAIPDIVIESAPSLSPSPILQNADIDGGSF